MILVIRPRSPHHHQKQRAMVNCLFYKRSFQKINLKRFTQKILKSENNIVKKAKMKHNNKFKSSLADHSSTSSISCVWLDNCCWSQQDTFHCPLIDYRVRFLGEICTAGCDLCALALVQGARRKKQRVRKKGVNVAAHSWLLIKILLNWNINYEMRDWEVPDTYLVALSRLKYSPQTARDSHCARCVLRWSFQVHNYVPSSSHLPL